MKRFKISQAKRTKFMTNEKYQKMCNTMSYYSTASYLDDVEDYINAIQQGRMMCVIHKVSQSGMSRVMSYHSLEVGKERCNYRQYWSLFKVLGWSEVKDYHAFRINGCGMDMVFHVNYSNIHDFYRQGLISKEMCDKFAQMTPVKF